MRVRNDWPCSRMSCSPCRIPWLPAIHRRRHSTNMWTGACLHCARNPVTERCRNSKMLAIANALPAWNTPNVPWINAKGPSKLELGRQASPTQTILTPMSAPNPSARQIAVQHSWASVPVLCQMDWAPGCHTQPHVQLNSSATRRNLSMRTARASKSNSGAPTSSQIACVKRANLYPCFVHNYVNAVPPSPDSREACAWKARTVCNRWSFLSMSNHRGERPLANASEAPGPTACHTMRRNVAARRQQTYQLVARRVAKREIKLRIEHVQRLRWKQPAGINKPMAPNAEQSNN